MMNYINKCFIKFAFSKHFKIQIFLTILRLLSAICLTQLWETKRGNAHLNYTCTTSGKVQNNKQRGQT